jgi:hypothetical protein
MEPSSFVVILEVLGKVLLGLIVLAVVVGLIYLLWRYGS